jgi:hypothetical protein
MVREYQPTFGEEHLAPIFRVEEYVKRGTSIKQVEVEQQVISIAWISP